MIGMNSDVDKNLEVEVMLFEVKSRNHIELSFKCLVIIILKLVLEHRFLFLDVVLN